MSAFEEVGLCPEIIQAIEEDDWLLPTAVQQEAIPLILTGGDVCAAAETGSGKTGAFGLPALQVVHENLRGKCQVKGSTSSGKKCQLSAGDKDMLMRVTEDGLECKSEDTKRWCGVRATHDVRDGMYMYEVEAVEGLIRVGWSASSTDLELGIEDRSFGYGSTGKKSRGRKFEDYGETFQAGDIIGCLLDREKHTVSFTKNGKDLGVAFTIPEELKKVGLKPHICGKAFAAAAKFDGPLEYGVEKYTPIGQIDPEHTSGASAPETGKQPPMCLILEPTRDLADQTYKCMAKFSKYLENPPVRVGLFVGGVDEKPQLAQLDRGVDIVVGTLPKVMDYVKRGKLDVSHIKFFVLDEADDLQKKDDKKDLQKLNAEIKNGRKDRVQTLFFSATLHTPEVTTLIEEICTRPQWVDLKGKDAVPDTVHHVVYYIDPTEQLRWSDAECASRAKFSEEQPPSDGIHSKPSLSDFDKDNSKALKLSENIKKMKPKMVLKIADTFNMSQCLVFCRTNWDCNNLEAYFNKLDGARPFKGKLESGKENPYSCAVMSGQRGQKDRERALEAFKEGDVRFLVCTDVAARGIDISGLPFVIQMTLSDDIENYVHRIGRCGRAERLGLCVSMVATEREKVWYFKNKTKTPQNGSTKLTLPYGTDGNLKSEDKNKWLVEESGDAVWFDEPDLIERVEKRIGQDLLVMDPDDFQVDGVLESPLPVDQRKKRDAGGPTEAPSRRGIKRKKQDAKAVTYGEKKKNASTQVVSKYASAIAPTVRELNAMEEQVQKLFAKAMWGSNISSSSVAVAVALAERPKPAAVAPAAAGDVGDGQPEAKKVKKKVRW
mmetsp:Transcript_175329/g.562407  ORF Transcript_175329/g.562407 Transcript_175329/m.562407 type:complete len:830 (-) Transcript_175329:90-2579(-)|eukprot:CAMPEP_0203870874 /NCGR_PEP_ID=MMETSP0359-20131031/18456_1 /ASSEMBLY_ACC=CAM_ASM_000338 /TAXON_ID=268821 /ORGANISM="Scrippsiella Hangoei, Strain SHTV-5" /LENGTH=829 /DNA_ID=CAMNT_0050789545 /DNA_START=62 /DNA_END=2551 /DNA_ORIENTATION=+